jgi:glycolate oxidase FAD binding subunit
MKPSTVEEAAALLAEASAPVRPVGHGTRADWGGPDTTKVSDVDMSAMDKVLEHNPGDFTAVLQAGAPLARVQATLAGAGQWLAVDPPGGGTIGGLVATADSGPARHRYGGLRDLVIGITVVLADGTVASAGGKVIKNVAGYDLGKLFTGSLGTLGLIASVAVRLHPKPAGTVTVVASTGDPDALGRAALDLARRPLEALSLDAWWDRDAGGLLVRFQGVSAAGQATAIGPALSGFDVSIVEADEPLWTEQRARQRCPTGVIVKVSGRPTDLPRVIAAARQHRATVASRAGLGLSWLAFGAGDDLVRRVDAARSALAPRSTTVLDGAALVANAWPVADPGALELMRRVKARFDPAGKFRPGVGGI